MVENEQTDTPKPDGKETDKPHEDTDKPLSMYEKTEKILNQEKEQLDRREKLIEREEKLHANQRLAGTAGGHIETEKLSDEEIASNKRVQMIGEMTGAEWAKEKK